jgi:hypothetical protein
MAAESDRRTASSVTLYDSLTASGPDNGQPFPFIGSRDNSAANTDGSLGLLLQSHCTGWQGKLPSPAKASS